MACKKLQLITSLFSTEFEASFNTILVGGADEPLYLPATMESRFCRIFYRQDFVSSALHEIA
ncbi:MAG: elongation factor P hydroxylase, partial [Flavobacteriaceae bacterium]